MPRKVKWGDKTFTGSYKDNKGDQYRGTVGETHIVRVMTDILNFRTHKVDDVRPPDNEGEPQSFNKICSMDWDEEAEDWVGDCLGCERDYDFQEKFIAGVLLVAVYKKGKEKPQLIDPSNAVLFWDFGRDKFRQLDDIVENLQRSKKPKKLNQVELSITCQKQQMQDLTIQISTGDILTKKEHIQEFKESGNKKVEEACKGDSPTEWKRNLKKKKPKRGRDESEERPAKTSRRVRKQAPPEDEPEGNDAGEDAEDLDDLLDEMLD